MSLSSTQALSQAYAAFSAVIRLRTRFPSPYRDRLAGHTDRPAHAARPPADALSTIPGQGWPPLESSQRPYQVDCPALYQPAASGPSSTAADAPAHGCYTTLYKE